MFSSLSQGCCHDGFMTNMKLVTNVVAHWDAMISLYHGCVAQGVLKPLYMFDFMWIVFV